MMNLRRTAVSVAIAVGFASTIAAAAPAAAATTANCPSRAVCIQELDGSIRSGNIFYSYGVHRLRNVLGNKILVNNQTGGAGYQVCFDYDGRRCSEVVRWTGPSAPYNMTPINSIVLVR